MQKDNNIRAPSAYMNVNSIMDKDKKKKIRHVESASKLLRLVHNHSALEQVTKVTRQELSL